jgi:hypothetical protein
MRRTTKLNDANGAVTPSFALIDDLSSCAVDVSHLKIKFVGAARTASSTALRRRIQLSAVSSHCRDPAKSSIWPKHTELRRI